MENIYIQILFLIFIVVIACLIYNVINQDNQMKNEKCKLENFDIDDLVVIKRTPEYSKLINGLIDEKSFIFNDDQIKVLKNPQQIFYTSDNANNIENISQNVYLNCSKELEQDNDNFSNNPVDYSSNEYDKIEKMLYDDTKKLIGANCYNTSVLRDIPLVKNYLKNYYQDLYGNKVQTNLSDYFTAYYTLINEDEDVGLPVNTLLGHSNFVIPDQYKYDSKFTNAYNIDWDRIINPISYSV
jgi:hypothetical protein